MTTLEELSTEVYEKCCAFEKSYTGCAQALIAALEDYLQLDKALFKGVTALSGGVGLACNGPCAGLTAGAVVIGAMVGRDWRELQKLRGVVKSSALVRQLEQKFINEYGSFVCKDIHQNLFGRTFKLFDLQDFQEFEKLGGHTEKCPQVIGLCARWVLEILAEQPKIREMLLTAASSTSAKR